MATNFGFEVNLTDRNGNPMIGIEVEAIDINLFTVALPDPIHYIAGIATTDISGTARFYNLPIGDYFARPRIIHREDMRIQVTRPSAMSGGGKMCYAACVEQHGLGSHSTIQAAITSLGITGGTIFICGGTYTENLVIAAHTANLWLVGASRGQCIIVGNLVTDATGGAPGISNFRMEHLTLNGNAGTILLFNALGGTLPVGIVLSDLLMINAAVAINFSSAFGASDVTIQNVDMTTTVVAAGQFEVNSLEINDCRWLISGTGPYIGGASAVTNVIISNSTLWGAGTYVVQMRNASSVLLSGCNLWGIAATAISLLGSLADIELSNSIIITQEGKAIDASNALGIVGLVIANIQARCQTPQATDRIGFDITGAGTSELVISGCRLKNYESYGIKMSAVENWSISETVIINAGDTHSIYLAATVDYGVITGCMLRGMAGVATTYGVYGVAGVSYTVISGNTVRDHDGITNLLNGVDGNYIGGNAGSGGSPAAQRYFDKIVAASDSTADAKAWADYTCDGVADNVEIMLALSFAAQIRVLLMPGHYYLAVGIVVGSQKALIGGGDSVTIITQPNATNLPIMIEVTGADSALQDFQIDGNMANNAAVAGIQTTAISGTFMFHLQIKNCDSGYVETGGAGVWNNMTNCNLQNSVTVPYTVTGASTRLVNNFLTPDRSLQGKDPNDGQVLRLYQAGGTEFFRATGANKYLEICNAGFLRIYTDLAATIVFTISGVSDAANQFTTTKATTGQAKFNLNMATAQGYLELVNGMLLRGYSGNYANLTYMIRADRGTAEFDPNADYIGLRITRNINAAANPVCSLVQQHATGNSEVLKLTQGNAALGCIDFVASDRGAITTSVTDSLASVRVELNGTVYRIPLFVDA